MADASRFSFGDVVLVPFPFTDQSGTKKRPAAVVSSASYSANRPPHQALAAKTRAEAFALAA